MILLRKDHTCLLLNRFPYTTGHLMIVTLRHVATLVDTSPAELNQIIVLACECERVLRKVYQPHGFNIGFNIGKSAGAGVAGHLHLHVVPRWEGDANFVSVVGQTRLIPEDIEKTYDKLSPHFCSE
ncbi:HIT domain-containing protein [Acidobacteria bacterium AH-259-L09]|nr:HIT domain-containing protein [Acidobacteria bacterium AH-259-L09]